MGQFSDSYSHQGIGGQAENCGILRQSLATGALESSDAGLGAEHAVSANLQIR